MLFWASKPPCHLYYCKSNHHTFVTALPYNSIPSLERIKKELILLDYACKGYFSKLTNRYAIKVKIRVGRAIELSKNNNDSASEEHRLSP